MLLRIQWHVVACGVIHLLCRFSPMLPPFSNPSYELLPGSLFCAFGEAFEAESIHRRIRLKKKFNFFSKTIPLLAHQVWM